MLEYQSESSFNHFFMQRPKKSQQNVQFAFPSRQAILENYSSLKQCINNLNSNQNQDTLKKKYAYLHCKFCSAHVYLKLNSNEQVQVSQYDNWHIHSSNFYKKNQQIQILQFIDRLQANKNHMEVIMQTFNISKRRYYYIINKAERNIKFEQLLFQLQQKGYDILIQNSSNDKFPEIMLYSTPEMGQLYRKFGDVCSFDITYNIIRQRSINGKQWGIGFFTGFDTNMRILIFAVVVMSNESATSMQKLFEGFFKLFHKQPSVIITDEQLSIIAALKKMKQQEQFHGYHLFDIFHILKNARKKVDRKQFPFYKRLLKNRNSQAFAATVDNAIQSQINREKLKDFIIQKAPYACFSTIPDVFIGMSSSSSRNEKLNDILKGFIPREVHWTTFFHRMQKAMKHICLNLSKRQLQCKPYQDLFKDVGLLEVRRKVEKKIFNEFLSNYVRALRYNCQKINQTKYVCWSFKQKWIVQDNQCKCGISVKSGIPCQHILKISWSEGKFDYLKFFNRRWIIDEEVQKEMRGRPKNSRKNLIK